LKTIHRFGGRATLTLLLLAAITGQVGAAEAYQPPKAEETLRTLKAEHPRLLLSPGRIAAIKQLVASDPVAAGIQRAIIESADRVLAKKPVFYELRDGRRLLYVSGEVLDRVNALAFAFLMTGKREYAERTWRELEAVANFKDWNPDHFLDVAVMTNAVAVGYDWLWEEWTPGQRATIRAAIVEKGLKPAMGVYEGTAAGMAWHRGNINWNQVCNGGITLGALAIADEEPELASRILAHALASIPRPMREYAPDGAGKEGVSYWDFGSRYNVLMLASLDTALGTDFGVGRVDGFMQSGDYQIYLSGAGRLAFDFGDCSLSRVSTPQHFWMGKYFDIPRYSWFRHSALSGGRGGGVYDLLWFDASGAAFDEQAMPLDKLFRGAEVASMRDTWTDGEGFAVALQGGANRGSHRHQDLGSFILEADGIRWIIDSGKEDQTYQRHVNNTAREDFYRVRAEGHNTLVFNPDHGPGQDMDAVAVFQSFDSKPDRAEAVLDLSRTYPAHATRVTRAFTLQRGRKFTVTDQIACEKPAEIWSFFHTTADVKLAADGRLATLTQDGKSLKVSLASPANAVFEVMSASPLPTSPNPSVQNANKGRRKLAVHLNGVESATIEVRFER
jgi:hypothetical protein